MTSKHLTSYQTSVFSSVKVADMQMTSKRFLSPSSLNPASSLTLQRPRDAYPPSPQQDLPGLPTGRQKPKLRKGQPVNLDSPAWCISIGRWEKPLLLPVQVFLQKCLGKRKTKRESGHKERMHNWPLSAAAGPQQCGRAAETWVSTGLSTDATTGQPKAVT